MTYSEDKQWWWDGQKWIPADQAPPQAQPPPPTPPTPPKRPRGRRGLWIALGAALVVLLGVCTVAIANSGSTANKKPAAQSSQAPSSAPVNATSVPTSKAAAPDGGCSPQPCANDNYGWIVTAGNLHYNAPSGNEYEKPEAGNVFVTVDVNFTNKTQREQHADPFQFVLRDGAGIKHSTSFLSGACASWQAVNITPGNSFGPRCIVFQAAADKPSGLVLVWTPSGIGGGYEMKLS